VKKASRAMWIASLLGRNIVQKLQEGGNTMVGEASEHVSMPMGPQQFLQAGRERTQAILNMQIDLLDTYQEAFRNWQTRAKSEMDVWSELTKELTEARSLPDSLEAYRHCLSRRIQLAAEDGQHLLDDTQSIVSVIARSCIPGSNKTA
jgi:hypothetical protein